MNNIEEKFEPNVVVHKRFRGWAMPEEDKQELKTYISNLLDSTALTHLRHITNTLGEDNPTDTKDVEANELNKVLNQAQDNIDGYNQAVYEQAERIKLAKEKIEN
jgi:hypothetical protein